VPSRVARSVVSGMAAEGIRYQVGIAFNQPIEMPEMPPDLAAAEQPPLPGDLTPQESTPTPEAPKKPLVNRW
jgi:hypothetical protein